MARLHFSLVKAALASDHTAVAALTSETFDLAAPLKENGVTDIAVTAPDTLTVRIGQSLELAHITSLVAGALTGTWTRGAEGSTPTAHSSGDIVRHVITDADFGAAGAEALDDLTDVDTTSTPPTDGQALVYDDGSGLWVPGTVAGGTLSVDEEGTPVVASASAVNFVGPGVTVTDGGSGEAVVTISGGGSGDVATDGIWDAKGDIAGGTGADTAARLAVGTNGYALVANSAETTGLEWVNIGSVATQVVPSADTTAALTGATNFIDFATAFAATLTVPSGHAVAVEATITWGGSVTQAGYFFRIMRDSTELIRFRVVQEEGTWAGGWKHMRNFHFDDLSPTAGAHTYKIQAAGTNAETMNLGGTDASGRSVLTVRSYYKAP